MSAPRARGFVRGDFDPAFPLDDKVQRLRALTDAKGYHAAMSVYWHVVAAAWRKAERKVAIDICPDMPDEVSLLVTAGLLDRRGRLPLTTFDSWIGQALKSRALASERKYKSRTGMSRHVPRDSSVTGQGATEALGREGVLSVDTPKPSSLEGGLGGTGLAHLTPEAIGGLEGRTGRPWSMAGDKQLAEYDRLIDDHGLPRVLAAFDALANGQRLTARQLVWGAVRALEPFLSEKDTQRAEAEKREEIRSRKAVEATIRKAHETGFHEKGPDPRCPLCP